MTYSGPKVRSNCWRKRTASAGAQPLVEMAMVRAPWRITAPAVKSALRHIVRNVEKGAFCLSFLTDGSMHGRELSVTMTRWAPCRSPVDKGARARQ